MAADCLPGEALNSAQTQGTEVVSKLAPNLHSKMQISIESPPRAAAVAAARATPTRATTFSSTREGRRRKSRFNRTRKRTRIL